jgi:hypothetical protein
MAQLLNTTISTTGFIGLPAGTTAQRPGSPAAGMIRYNTSLQQTEYYDGAAWRSVSDSNPVATGGTVTDTEIAGVPYRVHTFTATGASTFTVTKSGEVEYLIVAGGGAGGGRHAGGGGGGGVLTGVASVTPQAYTITVGTGGVPGGYGSRGGNGGNSSAFGITTIGGGGGGGYNDGNPTNSGAAGGSGGGGASVTGLPGGPGTGGAGTDGQGFAGANGPFGGDWAGGGGGGAGGPGREPITAADGGLGGPGLASAITGVTIFYGGGGGGGGGGGPGTTTGGIGGIGGGGRGTSQYNPVTGNPGAANTGGGGGGTRDGAGTSGGTGIVIIRYRRNDTTTPSASLVRSTLPSSSPRDFLVQEGLVLNLDASNQASYAGFGATPSYSSQGTTWRNLANPSVNGTINGDLGFERGAPDHNRFVFTSSQFVATSNFLLGNGPTAWTLNAWVNTTTTADGLGLGAVASNASGGPVYSSIGVNAGRISYWTYEGQWLRRIGNITVNDGRWHMLTWVNYPNSTMAMYVDGILDVENQRSISGNNNPIDRFGGSWAGFFDGRISQITINLNRFLTSSEITQTFDSTRWRFGV